MKDIGCYLGERQEPSADVLEKYGEDRFEFLSLKSANIQAEPLFLLPEDQ